MAQRTHYADLLRISAAFMVVLLHVAAQYWASVPVFNKRISKDNTRFTDFNIVLT